MVIEKQCTDIYFAGRYVHWKILSFTGTKKVKSNFAEPGGKCASSKFIYFSRSSRKTGKLESWCVKKGWFADIRRKIQGDKEPDKLCQSMCFGHKLFLLIRFIRKFLALGSIWQYFEEILPLMLAYCVWNQLYWLIAKIVGQLFFALSSLQLQLPNINWPVCWWWWTMQLQVKLCWQEVW